MRSTSRESKNSVLAEWRSTFRANLSFAKKFCKTLTPEQRSSLKTISRDFRLTLLAGELRLIEGSWYVTHAGLMHLSIRNRCYGIDVRPSAPHSPTPPPLAGLSERRSTNLQTAEVSSATATPIRPMFLHWSAAPRCGWPRPGRSTGLCARPMASASVRWRRSVRLPNRLLPLESRRSFRPSPSTGTTAGPRSVTAYASSSASTNSMPPSSSRTPPTSAAPRLSAKPLVSR